MYKRGRTQFRQSSSSVSSRSRSPSASRSRSAMSTNLSGRSTTSFRRPRTSGGFKGKSLKAVVNYISNNLPKPEKKYILTENSAQFSHTNYDGLPNMTPVLLNAMARGDTVQTRTSDHVTLGRGKMKCTLHTRNGCSTVRFIVLIDKEPGKAALTNTMLFGTSTPSATQFFDFNNKDIFERFAILTEKTYAIQSPSAGYTDAGSVPAVPLGTLEQATLVDISWDCNKYVASYKGGNAGTIADIDNGAVYILFQQSVARGMLTENAYGSFCSSFQAVQYFVDL